MILIVWNQILNTITDLRRTQLDFKIFREEALDLKNIERANVQKVLDELKALNNKSGIFHAEQVKINKQYHWN